MLVGAIFVSSCGMPSPIMPTSTPRITPVEGPLPTVTPVCVSSEPAQSDIDRALEYTGGLLDTPEWERSYSVAENRVSVTWLNNSLGAVIYLEALIFPCSYEEPDLNEYFSDENWDIIFENYESYEASGGCRTNEGLRLYQFGASDQGVDYRINYWAEHDTDTRVIVVMMTFPVGAENILDDFSSRLFPRLTSCQ